MKIFIGGSFNNRVEVRKYMDKAIALGHVITHDWTSVVTQPDSASRARTAKIDQEAVKDADVAIFIMDDPNYPYRGTFTELGMSIAYGKNIIIVNPLEKIAAMTNVYYHHPSIIHVKTWDDVVRELSV